MKPKRERIGEAAVRLIFLVLVLMVLALFNYVGISFVYKLPYMREFSGAGRVFGALLVGVPTIYVDIRLFRFLRYEIRERGWVAENKRKHEQEVRQEQLNREKRGAKD